MIRLPRKIVLFGVSKSGKSTLGAALEKRYGHQVRAFADPLKVVAKEIFGFSDEHLYGSSEARETRYPAFTFSGWCFECHVYCEGPERHLDLLYANNMPMIEDICEQYSDVADYFVCPKCRAAYPKHVTVREALKTLGTGWGRRYVNNLWAEACFAKMSNESGYIVTDGRFRNELGAAVRYRSCTVLLLRGLGDSGSPHPSEAEVREMASTCRFDAILDNTEGTARENFDKLVTLLSGGPHGWMRPDIEWQQYHAREGDRHALENADTRGDPR